MNTITQDDYATPEQIARNLDRLRRLGDVGQTGNLLAEWDAAERQASMAARLAHYAAAERERAAQVALHARGSDLPLFT